MPVNKLALIRYKTIDSCLQNRLRKWTLEDIVEACSETLYEYEGIKRGVSKRTVQLDIQNMRSDKLGYSAPIIVTDKKYYSYEDKKYTITNIPLSQQDLNTLNEVLGILRQFKGFGHFQELNDMVTRLDDKLYQQQHDGVSYIDMEKNELLKGLEHIDSIHKAIINKKVLLITYQSFKATFAKVFNFSPHLLKEYRNRWFVLGSGRHPHDIFILALDRITTFTESADANYLAAPYDISTYFADAIGATRMPNQKPGEVVFKVVKEHAPYVITKPLHHSQKVVKVEEDGTIFTIRVVWNFELEREILGFADFMKVLGPRRLAKKIMMRSRAAAESYRLTDTDKKKENESPEDNVA